MLKKTTLLAIAGLAVAALPAKAEDKIDFGKQIWPQIENSCAKCHLPEYKDERGRSRRPKGGLVITNKEDFLKGSEGEEEGEYNKVIVASEPEKSPFLTRTMLDPSDDDAMPPEGKADPWTDEQKALFKKWIEEGADFGEWAGFEGKTLEDLTKKLTAK